MSKVITWKLDSSGNLTLADIHARSLDEVSMSLPQGVYTTFRTYQRTKALDLDHHFDRLERSSAMLDQFIHLDRDKIRVAIRKTLLELDEGDHRLRIQSVFQGKEPTLYISAEPLALLPPEAYQNGVKVIFSHLQRETPEAKSTRFIPDADHERKHLSVHVNEALMTDANGNILEGLSSNFFAMHNGNLYTAELGVLKGITRGLVIECAAGLDIPVIYHPIHKSNLAKLDEAFITSASRGILPVVQVGETIIANEKPGQITRALAQAFDQLIEMRIAEI